MDWPPRASTRPIEPGPSFEEDWTLNVPIDPQPAHGVAPRVAQKRVAVYPGAFDPVHLGHVDVAMRAATMFDVLIVAVFDRPNKPLTFSGSERIELFRLALRSVPNVRVLGYDGLTIDFAR